MTEKKFSVSRPCTASSAHSTLSLLGSCFAFGILAVASVLSEECTSSLLSACTAAGTTFHIAAAWWCSS